MEMGGGDPTATAAGDLIDPATHDPNVFHGGMDHFGDLMSQPIGQNVVSMTFDTYEPPAQVMQPLSAASPSFVPVVVVPAASPAILPVASLKSHAPDSTAISEPSEASLAEAATSSSPAVGAPNSSATNPALFGTSAMDSTEGGFVTLDAPTAGTLNSDASALLSADAMSASQIAAMEVMSWPGLHGQTLGGNASHTSENLATSAAARRSSTTFASASRGQEGGSIELAIADPLPAADNLPGDAVAIDAATSSASAIGGKAVQGCSAISRWQ